MKLTTRLLATISGLKEIIKTYEEKGLEVGWIEIEILKFRDNGDTTFSIPINPHID